MNPHWHLHATVEPHRNWSFTDFAKALEKDIENQGIKPVIITNHYRDDRRAPYREIIPTKHFEGTEAEATRKLFRMGTLLNNSGWRVRRLKIEGDPSYYPPEQAAHGAHVRQRALYYETHIKLTACAINDITHVVDIARSIGAAISTTPRSTFATIRHPAFGYVYGQATELRQCLGGNEPIPIQQIEAAVLDTRPEMDDDWLGL